MDRNLIDQYIAAGTKLRDAVAGLDADQLRAHPVEGQWSIQQVAAHLLDSDLVSIDRMKRVIAMNEPTLMGYDETAFARSLHADQLDTDLVCEAFEINRKLMGTILKNLPDEAFDRRGNHSEEGMRTLGQFVEAYIHHVDHHLAFVEQKRVAMGV